MLSLSRNQIRQVDADAITELGLPSLLLMENAARGVCSAVIAGGPWQSLTILCGPGNNGGDGLAVARLLAASGIIASTLLIRGGKNLSADAEANLGFLTKAGLSVELPDTVEIAGKLAELGQTDLIIDALLGTGVRGDVVDPFAAIIGAINQSGAKVISIDVPSGLDCDLGTPCGVAVRAHRTVTFVAIKEGFLMPGASEYTGIVEICHIGIPQCWLDQWCGRR